MDVSSSKNIFRHPVTLSIKFLVIFMATTFGYRNVNVQSSAETKKLSRKPLQLLWIKQLERGWETKLSPWLEAATITLQALLSS